MDSESFIDGWECNNLHVYLAPDGTEIGNLLATSFGELPRQSTIEETMENMTLTHSQTG